MRFIEKNRRQPSLLLRHSRLAHADFDNLSQTAGAKDQLKHNLLKEQGHICCYCMQRITFDDMKVEHWASQKKFPKQQLIYKNLLAACMGGEGYQDHLHHCDTKKGDSRLSFHPADRDSRCDTRIRYGSNGKVTCEEEEVDRELNEVLNLNMATMVINRKVFLVAAVEALTAKHPRKTWTVRLLDQEIEHWKTMQSERLEPFCHVMIQYLENKKRIVSRR